MELEVLKKSWASLNEKFQHTTTFNQKLIESIISSRAFTTVDRIKRMYTGFYIVLTVEIVVLVAILVGNPFDFQYNLQFLPYALLLIGVIIAFMNLRHLSSAINKLSARSTIDLYLKGIVSIYDQNKRYEKWFGVSLLAVGLLVPFSFLPQKLERMNLTAALADTAIMISISLVLYVAAFKLGAFKNRHKESLQKDLADWEELKVLADEMN
jgi:tryptophan-rich sensory protein